MEIFKGGGKGVETALFEEAFHPQLNARGVQHVLALLAVNLRRRGQTVAALIFIDQGADIAVADAVHHLHQIADRPGVHREAKLNLRGDFIAVGHRHFAHVTYENKVKANIEKTIENRKLQDQIFEVRVPLQDVVEMKGGVKKNVSKKMFPGYVLVNMVMNDDTWYVVRNTRGVTGFVGPGSDPVPLSEAEMRNLGIVAQSDNEVEIDIEIGDLVEVTSGAWEGRVSTVTAINMNKQTVTIEVDMFGRETSVEIEFVDVKKL